MHVVVSFLGGNTGLSFYPKSTWQYYSNSFKGISQGPFDNIPKGNNLKWDQEWLKTVIIENRKK